MIFKNLYTNIIIRVIFITLTSFLLFFANQKFNDIIININLIAFLVLQVVLLIRKLNYFNRDLIAFFDSLKYDDSSILLTNEFQNNNYMRLSRRLQIVNKQILKLKEESAKQGQYFKTITDIANVGLISFNEKGEVKLANKAVMDMLVLEKLTNISTLDNLHPEFSNTLLELKPSEHKIIKLKNNLDELLQLSVRLADFKTNEENLKIVSMQNIKNELDEKELEAWQKLTKTLRHEIMNSIGPISSTIETLNEIVTNPETRKPLVAAQVTNHHIQDISEGLNIIKERNIGLQKFVDGFRTISKLPAPEFEHVALKPLIASIHTIWKKEFENQQINFSYNSSGDIELIADKTQIEQVFINLIKNAVEAGCKNIAFKAFETENGNVNITITDDGKGIPADLSDEIFLPFCTTKEQGSGIGLSLARQIMRLHGGTISVVSEQKNEELNQKGETTFTLSF